MNKNKFLNAALSVGLISFSFAASNAVAEKSDTTGSVTVVTAKPKLSRSLLEVAQPLPMLTPALKQKMKASGEKVPGEDFFYEVKNHNYPLAKEYIEKYSNVEKDPVLQFSKQKKSANKMLAPSILTGFDGMSNVQGAVPPDTNADVGPNHIVQTVNTALAIWDKSGTQLLGPIAINTLWSGFGGLCESTNRGDPIVLYDSAADRWLISQFAFNGSMTDNRQCIAISQTGDPTGAYYLYDFLYSTTKFNDYPHYGVWHNGYYAGVNQFTGNSYSGGGVVAYERDKMLLGQAAQQVIVDLEGSTPDGFTPMPADIDGIFMPPTSMPQYFLTTDAASTLDVWQFDVDWDDAASATFTHSQTLSVASYNGAVCGFSRDCVTQPGSQKLDAISQRMMFRLAYRNLNGAAHKLVANHTVIGESSTIPGVRWYELDINGTDGVVSVANQGTYSLGDGNARWMGSAAMDAVGNIGVAYSVSGPTVYPSLRFSGREQGDPADQLTVTEQVLKAGEGSQSGANRWGDYSSLSVDPSDDCTFWYSTEYYKAAADNTTSWQTYIGSFKFPNCVAGPAGTISGTVTDSETEEPIADVTVTVGAVTAITDASGNYEMLLPVADDYVVTFFKYGWNEFTQNDVDVAEDAEVDVDAALVGSTPVTVTGKVTDGSGLAVPLYAEIEVSAPGASFTTYSNPVTGDYSIDLFAGTLVKITAAAYVDGYTDLSADITPDITPVQDFVLMADASCIAPGYELTVPSIVEAFEIGVPPTNWSVSDLAGNGVIWESALGGRGNLLGTSGDAALIDSDAGGSVSVDSSLTSPVIQVSDLSSSNLSFTGLFRTYTGADSLDVEVNVDGAGWVSVYSVPATNAVAEHSVDLSAQLSGATSFQVRWHYYDGFWEWYALVDDVEFGGGVCVPRTGSFVNGYVTDNNTNSAVNGATVVAADQSVTSIATTEDSNIGDGFFSIFVPSTSESVVVSANNYSTKTVDATEVDLDSAIALDAGQLSIVSDVLTIRLTKGRSLTRDIELENTGNVDANYNIYLINGAPTKANGPFHPSTRHFGPKSLNELNTKKIRDKRDYSKMGVQTQKADLVNIFSTQITGWGMGLNQDTGDFWVGDLSLLGASQDALHKYTSAGVKTGDSIDTTAITYSFGADIAYNNRTGMLWQVAVGDANNCIYEIDPTTELVTGNSICPAVGSSQRGLTYDPVTNTFYSGSWNDSIVHQFDTNGTILRSVNVGLSIAGLALNPVSQQLYVQSNTASPNFDLVVLDTSSDTLSPVEAFNYPLYDITGDGEPDKLMDDNHQAGLALSCDGTLWGMNYQYQIVIGIDVGASDVCDWKPSWASFSATSTGTVEANDTAEVSGEFNGVDLEPGEYEAQLIVSGDTPYADSSQMVNIVVKAPRYGEFTFDESNVKVKNGEEVTLKVNRIGGSDYAVSVNYSMVDGTAVSGENYSGSSSTLTWEDGDKASKEITVRTRNHYRETNRYFSVVLSDATGGAALGNEKVAVVKIKGDSGGSLGLGLLTLFTLMMTFRRRQINK